MRDLRERVQFDQGCAQNQLRAARAGWRVTEVAVPYHPRRGRSKVTGTVRGTVGAMRDMNSES